MTDPSEPPRIDWFPGVRTGPVVGVGMTTSEIDLLRDMLDDCPNFMDSHIYGARLALRDLDVRIGALGELDASGTHEVVLRRSEHDALRLAFDDYRRYRSAGPRFREVDQLFTQLDRRIGAAQVKLAQSGMMSEEHFPHRVVIDVEDADWAPPGPRNSPERILDTGTPRRRRWPRR